MVKPSPKKRESTVYTEGIALPTTSTIIPPIPIKSPTGETMAKVKKTETVSDEFMKKIMSIDVTKLKAERVKGKDIGYSVSELKALAGGLNLTKTGNKKDLVERIKQAILKVNPAAFDNV